MNVEKEKFPHRNNIQKFHTLIIIIIIYDYVMKNIYIKFKVDVYVIVARGQTHSLLLTHTHNNSTTIILLFLDVVVEGKKERINVF